MLSSQVASDGESRFLVVFVLPILLGRSRSNKLYCGWEQLPLVHLHAEVAVVDAAAEVPTVLYQEYLTWLVDSTEPQ